MTRRSVCLRLAALLAPVALAACSVMPAARLAIDDPLSRYSLDGRFGLRDSREKGQSFQGRVQWQHSVAGDRVLVQDPFGGGIAELNENGRGARMVLANGEVSEAGDAPALMQALTGVALPVRGLARWLTGRDLPPGRVERDAMGRSLRFEIDGWKIQYEYDGSAAGDADLLPARVFAANGRGIELRLAVDAWNLNSDE